MEDSVQETGIVFNPTRFHFVANKNLDEEILKKLDEHLLAMKNNHSSIYYQSLKKWTSEESKFKLPVRIKMLLILFAFMLIFTFIGMYILKKTSISSNKRDSGK